MPWRRPGKSTILRRTAQTAQPRMTWAILGIPMAIRLQPESQRRSRKRRPKPQKRVRAKLTVAPLAVAGMLLAGLMLLLVICGYVQLYEATNEVGQLQDEIATLQEKNDRLQSTYDEKVDLNTVESEAAKLGMHKPNSKQSIELNLSGQDKAEIMTTEKENILQTAWKAITGTAKKMIEYFRERDIQFDKAQPGECAGLWCDRGNRCRAAACGAAHRAKMGNDDGRQKNRKTKMEYPTWGKEDPASNRLFLRRTFCIMAVCGILLFIPLIITLFHMMITKHDVDESQAIENQTRSTTISADRGTIYDRNMNVLASSSTVENVFLDPLELSQDKVDLNQLAQDLDDAES